MNDYMSATTQVITINCLWRYAKRTQYPLTNAKNHRIERIKKSSKVRAVRYLHTMPDRISYIIFITAVTVLCQSRNQD